ncbi:Soluble calcium-activated nucleotidase 1 [Phytophthora pseudosyringae]|uniref:Soluble calcium-activated nucleotidase 1 n=1 Tax=Phytophthora pseudosyringae TaxID=221518 RepID=A0A8T1WK24_9STRA|nr:Soluble calcium-activated nucleotidase 1 [Phytophthora pseudosyringae]
MLASCVDTKKKKRKLSTLEEASSSSMWSDSPLPSNGAAASSSRPPAAALAAMRRHGRALVLLVAFALVTYVSLSRSTLGGGSASSSAGAAGLRTPQNWGNDQPLLLPSVDAAKRHVRQEPTLAPPPKPDSFGIVIVADLDKNSKVEGSKKPQFVSYIMHATLKVTPGSSSATQKRDAYSVAFGEETKFSTSMNEAGRGFELSELAWFDGKLLAFDDRTGIVFRLKHFEGASRTKPLQAIPEHIIMEGDGLNGKGQKHEWATVKDGELYMGSVGKEFTDNDGNVIGDGNLWVAVMDRAGDVRHEDWTANFAAVRKALGCEWPGYVVHEAIEWSPVRRQWFILPRRVSTEVYNDMEDEKRGSNKVVVASEDFSSIQVREVGKVSPLRGFSSFKFVPRSDDSVIVAVKSVEVENEQRQTSFLTVFDLDGNVLMGETEIPGAKKYEGVAFAHDWS